MSKHDPSNASNESPEKPRKSGAKRPSATKKAGRKRAGTRPAKNSGTANRKPAAKSGKPVARKPGTRKPARNDQAAAQSTQPTSRAILISVPTMVRWRDLDAFNHVNNSKYLSYLEEARLQWLMTLPGEWIDDNVAPVVAAAHINYRRPIQWPNELVVELLVERLGNTSLTIGHRITHAQDADVLYADGNVVMVWIDKHRGQPAALPDCVRTACAAP